VRMCRCVHRPSNNADHEAGVTSRECFSWCAEKDATPFASLN
jgi:hypothetical protein